MNSVKYVIKDNLPLKKKKKNYLAKKRGRVVFFFFLVEREGDELVVQRTRKLFN